MPGQTTFTLTTPVAVPGMIYDYNDTTIRSFVASEAIYPGRFVELAADGISCRQLQQTGNATPTQLLGVAVFQTMRPGGGAVGISPTNGAIFNPGDIVPVLMEGSIWAEWKGTTQPAYGVVNAYHSSNLAADRGKITDAATSATVGSEISTLPACVKTRFASPGAGNLVVLDVNIPGA